MFFKRSKTWTCGSAKGSSRCYECGKGAAENNDEALYWYKKAASQKNPQSLYRLSCFQLEGFHSISRDTVKGLDFLIQAYKAGLKEIECNLIFLYNMYKNAYSQYKGKTISQNHIEELSILVHDANSGEQDAISIINSIL